MNSGAAGHVILEGMCPRVQLAPKTAPKTFVAGNGEQIRDLGEKTLRCNPNDKNHRCIAFRSASVVKTSHPNAGNGVVAGCRRFRTFEILEMEQWSSCTCT